MIEADLYSYLKNDTGISAIVGTRIYPKVAPQNVQTPYIVYHEIISDDNQCMGGVIYQTDTRFQVDCWSPKYSEVKALKTAVKTAIVGFKSSNSITTRDDYEPETNLYREMIDFILKD